MRGSRDRWAPVARRANSSRAGVLRVSGVSQAWPETSKSAWVEIARRLWISTRPVAGSKAALSAPDWNGVGGPPSRTRPCPAVSWTSAPLTPRSEAQLSQPRPSTGASRIDSGPVAPAWGNTRAGSSRAAESLTSARLSPVRPCAWNSRVASPMCMSPHACNCPAVLSKRTWLTRPRQCTGPATSERAMSPLESSICCRKLKGRPSLEWPVRSSKKRQRLPVEGPGAPVAA